jgi:hypothetical protein
MPLLLLPGTLYRRAPVSPCPAEETLKLETAWDLPTIDWRNAVSLFRTKNLDNMVAHAGTPGGLKKVLGPFDLILMGIGAIVGTGIFVLTGTGALTAGPALTLSFVVSAIACGFAALCYAEFASTVPVAGSIYTYSYAVLGELVAWMIGWDLLLEYGLATSAVSVGWSGYFQSLIGGFGLEIPKALSAAPGALEGVTTYMNLPALIIMLLLTAMLSWGVRESARVNNVMVDHQDLRRAALHPGRLQARQPGQLASVHAFRRQRRDERRRGRVLRLHRLRRRDLGRRGSQESEA